MEERGRIDIQATDLVLGRFCCYGRGVRIVGKRKNGGRKLESSRKREEE